MNIFDLINFEYYCIDVFSVCPHTFGDYFCMFSSDKKLLKSIFSFKCKYKFRESELIISCNPCTSIFKDIFFHVMILLGIF